jgi:hypothetical protein
MKVRLIRWLTVPTVLLGSTLAVAGPASAVPATCWTTGNFKANTTVMKVDWDGNGSTDECFGVAPDRTIWHEWSTSNGWRQMPGSGGRADDMLRPQVPAPGYRRVVVYVANPRSHWYQDFVPGSGWTARWVRCAAGVC